MPFNVNEFSGEFAWDGARVSHFQVQITNPVFGFEIKAPFMIKAATLPPSDLNVIEVPYMGRTLKYAGQRTFPPWEVEVLNDEDFALHTGLENWVNAINTLRSNLRALPSPSPQEYKATASVIQYSKVGDIIRVYNFQNLWPSAVSPITLNHGTDDMQYFSATFQYDWWEIDGAFSVTTGDVPPDG